MQPKFLTNLIFLILVNLLVKPFWIFGIDRTVQNMVGAADYGMFFAVFNYSYLFYILLDFGLANFNNRAIARNENLIHKFLPDILGLKAGLAIVYFLITFGTAFIVGFSTRQYHLLLFLSVNLIAISFLLYARSNLTALHFFKTDALVSVLDKLLMICGLSWILWGPGHTWEISVEIFVYVQCLAYLITAVTAFTLVWYYSGVFKIRFHFPSVKKLLKQSMPFALLGFLMAVYYRIDGVMIEQMLGKEGALEAGIYAASYRILDAFNMIGFAFSTLLLPMFSRMVKQGSSIRSLLSLSFRTLFFGAWLVVLISWFYNEPVMELLYPDSRLYWAKILSTLMPAFLGVATMYIFGPLLLAYGKLKVLNWIAFISLISNVALNVSLIPDMGAEGAAWATTLTQLMVAVYYIYAARKFSKVSIFPRTYLSILAFLSCSFLVFYGLRMSPYGPWITMALEIGICTGLAILFKVLDLAALFREFRKN